MIRVWYVRRLTQAPFHPDPHDRVVRNVRAYGAQGDGKTDDTDAINRAIADGARCGAQADSCTTAPALVFIPPGTYCVSRPIVSFYNTHILGDATERPVLKALPHFEGIALIDENPYHTDGKNWYTPQNNFFRSIANLVLDLTSMPPSAGTGIHHQVSQSTGLTNVHFEMVRGAASRQQGIFMENASGGFMSDLSFTGGRYGAWLGNQQFTVRNARFTHCHTAICQYWNWAWTYMDIHVEDCKIAIEMHAMHHDRQGVGALLLSDWAIRNTPIGVWLEDAQTGRLTLDHVRVHNVPAIVQDSRGTTLLAPPDGCTSHSVPLWIKAPASSSLVVPMPGIERHGSLFMGTPTVRPYRPACLVDAQGRWFGREKPQCTSPAYADPDASERDLVSVRNFGATGDGATDDRAALQAALDASVGKIVYGTPNA